MSDRVGWPWTNEATTASPSMPSGQSWPKITVVTPSFNQASYLEETIRSVLLQGYPNLEYIVMDGGSTDGSVDILQTYAPWLTYWQSERDGGQTSAINAGWRRATGEGVTWLNSDDVLAPDSLITAALALFSREGFDLVYGNVLVIDHESQPLYPLSGRSYSASEIIVRGNNPIPQPGFLMKRQLIERVGWLDESLHFAMDFDYWVRIALYGANVAHVDHCLAYFRSHVEAKTSTAYLTRIRDRYRIFEKVFDQSEEGRKFQSYRTVAAASVELNAAYIAYKANDATRARQHAFRHIQLARWSMSPIAVGILLKSFVPAIF